MRHLVKYIFHLIATNLYKTIHLFVSYNMYSIRVYDERFSKSHKNDFKKISQFTNQSNGLIKMILNYL